MNEQIKKLLDQATVDAIDATKDAVDFLDNPVTKQQRQLQLEKFAELIVRECVAICQDVDGEDNIDAKSGRQDCAVEIREHFGVEE
jgi:hypothetical protein